MGDAAGVPVEPPPGPWAFPAPRGDDDLVGVGADLEPGTLLAAYRAGLFPMPVDDPSTPAVLGWWSPVQRGILPLDKLRMTRSLARSRRRFEVRVDTAFEDVIEACADGRRAQGWITDEIRTAYVGLHGLGWAHSVEAWSLEDGSLAGGLYGIAIGGLFAGESMFHRERDASKVALAGLVDRLRDGVPRLLDVQWRTPHLQSLGAVEIPREDYLRRLAAALPQPPPRGFE
ncbi:MAG: leucyl/phenylalanyl-tRNA--protein transferase [Acidimicrobiales bacterium]